jgi:hypothetical protein
MLRAEIARCFAQHIDVSRLDAGDFQPHERRRVRPGKERSGGRTRLDPNRARLNACQSQHAAG